MQLGAYTVMLAATRSINVASAFVLQLRTNESQPLVRAHQVVDLKGAVTQWARARDFALHMTGQGVFAEMKGD